VSRGPAAPSTGGSWLGRGSPGSASFGRHSYGITAWPRSPSTAWAAASGSTGAETGAATASAERAESAPAAGAATATAEGAATARAAGAGATSDWRPSTPTATTMASNAGGTRSGNRSPLPAPGRTRPSADTASGEVDEDVLRLGVEVEGAHPELPPDPGHLVAAERRLRVDGAVRVDRDDARLESLRRPQRLADVAAPDRAGQPVRRRVGEAKGLLLGVEGDDRHHWPEDLLPGDSHVVRHAVEDR